jgi:pyruvate dehydrogenase (quinone)/pyruvate oxidase
MPNTSDIVFDTLLDWGVDTVFGLPGDGINGLMEALRVRRDRIRFVLVRHEEAAAFMATGYAKFTGRMGVCIATSGPGGVHLLNGLYDAKADQKPVLAITGQTYSDLIGSRYQQELAMTQLYQDVAAYNVQVSSAEHAHLATDWACRTAYAKQAVAHLNIPVDVQEWEFKGQFSKKHVPRPGTRLAHLSFAVRPPDDELQRAAELLNSAQRPVLLVGQGAGGARAQVLALARALQAPVVKALLGKDVVPDEDPHCVGYAGLLGTQPGAHALEHCDTLVLVGTSFPYMEYLPKPDRARAVQVDIDGARLGLRYPVDVGLVGDVRATLDALLPMLRERAEGNGWLPGLQDRMERWWRLIEERGTRDDVPMKPQVVAWELGKRLDDDAILTCDSGTIATWAARYIRIRGAQRFSLSGNLATMAPGLPYAIAAQVAWPERQVVAFVGDGGLLMLGSELSTAAAHDLPVKVVVCKNGILGMIKWEQMVFLGNPSYGITLPDVDLVKYAEAQGVAGFHAERPDEVGDVLDRFLAHDGPALLEAVVDPNEPPWPPHVTLEQAVNMGKAMARGEPNGRRIGLTLFRDKVEDLTRPAQPRAP